MEPELRSLKIDRTRRRKESRWASGWIIGGIVLILLIGGVATAARLLNNEREVDVVRVPPPATGSAEGTVVLNATGYVIAAHKIQVASKVIGRVAWIGVDKGDRVKEGQVIVRLEDDEFRAQLQQARGKLTSLEARLAELQAGSRDEEIDRARAEVEEGEANLTNAKIAYDRAEPLVRDGVQAKQILDDAKARLEREQARVNALRKQYELVRIGPRRETIASMRGQVEEARGEVAFYETQLANTLIKAPTTGTILERVVEKGEFVTTSFVGDRGAKGYVVSLADLSDLRAELDINQNDFAKIRRDHKAIVTTDAYPDRKYDGEIDEIAPEANRQKATVQIKVRILQPDEYLRPEMNANVAFLEPGKPGASTPKAAAIVVVPASAVRNNRVYLIANGKVVVREIRTSGTTQNGLRVDSGLTGGEELIVQPPEDLMEGDRVRARKAS